MSTPSIPVTRRPRAPNPQLSDGYLADLRWAGCLRGASTTGSWPCGTLRRRAVRTNGTWCWAYWGTRLVPGRLQLDPRIGHGPLSPSWDGGGPQLGVVRVASVSVHSELGGCGAKYHRRTAECSIALVQSSSINSWRSAFSALPSASWASTHGWVCVTWAAAPLTVGTRRPGPAGGAGCRPPCSITLDPDGFSRAPLRGPG